MLTGNLVKGGRSMGVVTDDGRHEMYAACVLADGSVVSSSSGLDGADVVGWVVRCDCAGESTEPRTTTLARWERVPVEREDLGQGLVACDGRDVLRLYDRDDVARCMDRLFDAHLAPERIGRAAVGVGAASRRLDQAVEDGREAGLSWADVGRAVGITRQAARERWGGS
jgi:hypothetical protein